MSTLKSKIRRYKQLKNQLPKLEAEIKEEARPILLSQGLLAIPRIERIVDQFG